MNPKTTNAQKSKRRLVLYRVTLAWNANDSREGDYCSNVWARDSDEAVKKLAGEMANHPDSGVRTRAEWSQFVNNQIANAPDYAAERVADNIGSDLVDLISGPKGLLTMDTKADLIAITILLSKYGFRDFDHIERAAA